MLQNIAKKFFGSANDRYIKDLQGKVDAINSIESELETLSDDNLSPGRPCSPCRYNKHPP